MSKLRLGIVGLGRLGLEHAKNLKFNIPNVSLEAICSINSKQLEELQKEWNIPYTFTSYVEMVNSGEIDAVVICSPSGLHVEQIKQALESGLHVFSEKPIALNLKDAEDISEVVNNYPNQKFMLGFMRRFDPAYATAKKMIDEGRIGKPYLVRCYSLDPNDAIEGFLEFSKNSPSGGIFMDLSIHDYDLSRWLLSAEPKKVWSIGGNFKYPEIAEFNDVEVASSLIQFEQEKIGMFLSSRSCIHGYHVETEIIGTNGILRIGKEPIKNDITILNENGVVEECFEGFVERFEIAYLEELKYFVECIIENKVPSVGVKDGVESIRLAEKAKSSLEEKTLKTV